MERYTLKNVEGVFRVAVNVGQAQGLDTQDWALRKGSPTYGRAWLLVDRSPLTGGEHTVQYLGWSAREAYLTLQAMVQAWVLVERTEVTTA